MLVVMMKSESKESSLLRTVPGHLQQNYAATRSVGRAYGENDGAYQTVKSELPHFLKLVHQIFT